MSLIESLVPRSKLAAVKKCLQEVFGTEDVEEISLLTGGFTSAMVYKIGVAGKFYVLRLVMHVDAFNDPVRQYACMNIAAEAGIAPRVLYSNAEDAISLSDFIALAPFRGSDTEKLVELARMVRAIHNTPLFPPLVDFLDGIDDFITNFKASGLLPESATAPHFELYAHIQKYYPRHTDDLVSCHNDLNPSNRLYDGQKFWVIDWETAFRSDRYLDLAATFNFSRGGAEETLYLQTYFGAEPTPMQRARFFLMRQVCYFFYALAMLQVVSATRAENFHADAGMEVLSLSEFHAQLTMGELSLSENETRLLYAKALLNEALRDMRTSGFAESIAQLKSHTANSRFSPSNASP